MRRTQDTKDSPGSIPLRDYHPLGCSVPGDFEFDPQGVPRSVTPHPDTISVPVRFALSRVQSPLLAGSRLISCPLPTKMLQFGRFPLANASAMREVPFGHPRFRGSMRLPGAFRRLARPSSASEPSYSPTSLAAMTRRHSPVLLVHHETMQSALRRLAQNARSGGAPARGVLAVSCPAIIGRVHPR